MNRRRLSASIFLVCVTFATQALAKDVEDARGRKVTLPDRIGKVFATSPPGTNLIYALDPQLLVGLNFPLWDSERKYTVPRLQTLPVIGGAVGMGRTINQEVLLEAKPDVIMVWDFNETAMNAEYETIFRRMGIPWVFVKADRVWDWPDALAMGGRIVGREERGRELQSMAKEMLGQVKAAVDALPMKSSPTVYYAEGFDGLATEGRGSFHTELIEAVGARNVHEGRKLAAHGYGMERVSLEQVMGYDPDVILVKERPFYDAIFKDPRWRNLRAIRERRAFLIPHEPFNWFDRPPSFMRVLGAQWLFSRLHPGRLPVDLKAQTKAFYRTFLGVRIDDGQAAELIGR